MKKLILISFIITLNMATVTNNGATITIGEGVTFKVDDDFVNNGTTEVMIEVIEWGDNKYMKHD